MVFRHHFVDLGLVHELEAWSSTVTRQKSGWGLEMDFGYVANQNVLLCQWSKEPQDAWTPKNFASCGELLAGWTYYFEQLVKSREGLFREFHPCWV
jgi:hypothetical protein